jgi:hypothetical protein
MSVFLLHFRTAWNDYFTASPTTNLSQQKYTSRPSPSGSNVYVSNCLFISISSTSGSGGALSLMSVKYFLVESTSFFSCRTSDTWGGAICFSNSGGQSVLHTVCGYDCYSTNTYPCFQFAYIEVNFADLSKNYFNYSSVTRCVYASNAKQVLRLLNGKIYCPSINLSMNRVKYYSAISCGPSSDSSSATCSISYSSFTDNTASEYTCIELYTTGAKYEMKSCNILRNTQGSLNNKGTICISGNLMIEDSCILENTATYIFCSSSSSYTITISNCTVDSTSNNGELTIKNTVTKSFILALNHMSTQNCHSEYDSVGTLTPFIRTASPSKSQNYYCACENFFYRHQPRNFVSLT